MNDKFSDSENTLKYPQVLISGCRHGGPGQTSAVKNAAAYPASFVACAISFSRVASATRLPSNPDKSS